MTRTLSTPASPFATRRAGRAGVPWSVLAVVSAGGVLGALARYGIGLALPVDPGTFPWATFVVNASGCLAIGVLMALVTDARLVRQFLGTGVLGGYTTFSVYVVEAQQLVQSGAARTALAYLGGTVVAALSAVYAGTALARLATRGRASRGRGRASRGRRPSKEAAA